MMEVREVALALNRYYQSFAHSTGEVGASDLLVGLSPVEGMVRIAHVVGIGQSAVSAVWIDVPPGAAALKMGADSFFYQVLGERKDGLNLRKIGGVSLSFDPIPFWARIFASIYETYRLSEAFDVADLGGEIGAVRFNLQLAELNRIGIESAFEALPKFGIQALWDQLEGLLLPGLYSAVDASSAEFGEMISNAEKAFDELG